MKEASRYHPLLVLLHWLIAVLLIASLAFGFLGLATVPNSDPEKIYTLQMHMVAGMVVLLLMLIRFAVRLFTSRPVKATTGHPVLDQLAIATHYAFYLLVPLMAITGYATAIQAHLPDIVFARSGAPLPETFLIYPTRVAHGYFAWTLVLLISLHIFAALYHQLLLKDGLLRRMLFGQRAVNRFDPEK